VRVLILHDTLSTSARLLVIAGFYLQQAGSGDCADPSSGVAVPGFSDLPAATNRFSTSAYAGV